MATDPRSQAPRDPFGTTPDVSAFVPRPAVDAALTSLIDAVRKGDRMALLCGPPGLGKTLLLRVLADRLSSEFLPLFVPFPSLPPDGLWRWILGTHDLPCGPDPRAEVESALRGLAQSDRRVLLLIDDACALPLETATALRELHASLRDVLSCVLVLGDDEVSSMVVDALGFGVNGVRLDTPMNAAETAEYVRRRLASAGRSGDSLARFDDATLARLHERGEGIPARIHEIADLLLRPEEAARHHEYSRELRPEAVRGAIKVRPAERVVDWADEDLARTVAGRRRSPGKRKRRAAGPPVGPGRRRAPAPPPEEEEILLVELAPDTQPWDEPNEAASAEPVEVERAAAPPPHEAAPRRIRRWLIPLATAAAFAIALLGGSWWFSGSPEIAAPPPPVASQGTAAPERKGPGKKELARRAAAEARAQAKAADATSVESPALAPAQADDAAAEEAGVGEAAPSEPRASAHQEADTSAGAAPVAQAPTPVQAADGQAEEAAVGEAVAAEPLAVAKQDPGASSAPAPVATAPVAPAPVETAPVETAPEQTAAAEAAPEPAVTAEAARAPAEPVVAQPEEPEPPAPKAAPAQAEAPVRKPAQVTSTRPPARARSKARLAPTFPKARAGASPPPEVAIPRTGEARPAPGDPVVAAPPAPSASATAPPVSASGTSSEGPRVAADTAAATPSLAVPAQRPRPSEAGSGLLPVRVRASAGAMVEIDGEPYGHAPLVGVPLTPGRHRVAITTADGKRVEVDAMIDRDHLVVDFD